MAKTELSNSKSICVLAVVVCCFAILWPKIFFPMFQSALSLTNPQIEDRKSDASMLPPKVREAMKLSRPEEFQKLPGRPLQMDNKININEQNPTKTGGLMGLVMPLYTIGVIVFFLYTILKIAFKNKSEDFDLIEEERDEKPIIKDYKLDPEYRKFILSDEYDENGDRIRSNRLPKRNLNSRDNFNNIKKSSRVVQNFGRDKDEIQINRLQKRLDETEEAMERILRHMNKMSGTLVANGILPSLSALPSAQTSATFCHNDQTINIIDKLKKEINEEIKKESNDSNDDNNDEIYEDIDNENTVFGEQNESESDSDIESKDIDNDVYEDMDDMNTNFNNQCQLNDEFINKIDSDVWDPVLKNFKSLEHLKEE